MTGDDAVVLSLAGVRDKAAFMERCARTFRLPGWFGRNWDALADCLTDLSWAPDIRAGLVVVSGWQEYARAAPGEWEAARQVLSDAAAHWRGTADGGFRLVFADTTGDDT
ncbi:barstar family protein [Streptomyces sp. NPDC050703]|uniref:barstar family protein n=1 Tax=Streptomyces sp. NPDC050703 TaxID=3157218 RepID=UPI0034161294